MRPYTITEESSPSPDAPAYLRLASILYHDHVKIFTNLFLACPKLAFSFIILIFRDQKKKKNAHKRLGFRTLHKVEDTKLPIAYLYFPTENNLQYPVFVFQ